METERLLDLVAESIGELPFEIMGIVADDHTYLFQLQHVTDGNCWFRLPAAAPLLSDLALLHLIDNRIEHILDVLWERAEKS